MTKYLLARKYEIPERKIDYWSELGLIRFKQDETNNYRIYDEKGEEDVQRLIILELMKVNKSEREAYMKLFDTVPASALDYLFGGRLDEEYDRINRIFEKADEYLCKLKEDKRKSEEDA